MLRLLLVVAAALLATAVPALAADENLAPTTTIFGGATQLGQPHGIAIDSAGLIYTANQMAANEAIFVHARNANGDAAPVREFHATSGGGGTPLGICIDGNDHVWVTYNNNIVNEFAPGASGAVAPLRTIDAGVGGGVGTRGIGIDSHGQIYVSSHDAPRILVYAANATGAATPIRIIEGGSTQLSNQMGLVIAPNDDLIVSANDRVLRFAYAADGNVAPTGSIRSPGPSGVFSGGEGPNGVALDNAGNVYVTDRVGSNVSVWPASALASAGDIDTPSRVITGAATGVVNPVGIALQPSTGAFAIANLGPWPGSVTVFGTLSDDSGHLTDPAPPTQGGGTPTGSSPATGSPSPTTQPRQPATGPVGVSIDNGADFTNSPEVTLHVVWPAGATTMLISNDGGFRNARSVAVADRVAWTLRSSGPDRLPKTVYVRFAGGGADETKTFTDDIILDQTAPVIDTARVDYLGGFNVLARRLMGVYRVYLHASDDLSGVNRIRLKMAPHSVISRRYARSLLVASPPLAVKVRDSAGNWSGWRKLG